MSVPKDQPLVSDSMKKVGAVVTVSVAVLAAKHFWHCWWLNRKLEKKRESCRKTLQTVQQQLQQNNLSAEKRDAILSLPLSTLQSKLQSEELKAVDVVRAYQSKALEVNAGINCVVEAITEAQEQAAVCDAMADKMRVLHGVPLSVKDNIGVKGYDTIGGMEINIGVPCEEDSVVIKVLKRYGAIPFIRTNVPQAMLSYACSNSIFGTTVSPLNRQHCPGGSSGGEGAVLGAGASIIGLGTDVGGSVRVPAAFCGVCAFKPTFGRISKLGLYTVNKGQTQIAGVAGPMARDVNSLVVMTRILTSPDMFELDPSLPPLPFQEQMLNSTHKLTIGYYTFDGILPPVPVVSRAISEARKALEALGHTLVQFHPPDYSNAFFEFFVGTMLGSDQGQTLKSQVKNDYLDLGLRWLKLTSLPRWLLSLLAKIVSYKEPLLGKILRNIKKDGRTYSWFCHVVRLQAYRQTFIKRWKSLGLDAVICPIFPSPAPKTEHIGHLTTAGSGSALYNVVNFPAGVLPVTKVTAEDVADVNNPGLYPARSHWERMLKESCSSEESIGLPVAVQCVTLPYREELCLRIMAELEAAVNYKAL